MEFKGTKGEFIIKDKDKNGVFITNNTGSFAVARVFRSSNVMLEEFEANAKLIASAPSLLEALQELLETCHCDPDITTEFWQANQKAKQAIEKALK